MRGDQVSDQPPTRPKSHRRHILILAAVGVVLLTGAIFFRHYYLRIPPPVGEGPAGPAVPRKPFAEVWSRQRVLVVGLGDSIVVGEGAKEGYGCFARLIANPPGEDGPMQGLCLKSVFPNLEVLNMAVSDTTSCGHAELQVPQIPPQGPNVLGIAVISSGGNDLLDFLNTGRPKDCALYGATLQQAEPWIAAYEQRLDAMLAQLETSFPGGCHIFMFNLYDPSDGDGPAPFLPALKWPDAMKVLRDNETIARCLARHPTAHLIDLHSLFMGHGFACARFWASTYRPEDPHFWYFTNWEDPNDRGHDAIRRLLLVEMARAFGKLQ